MARKQVIVPDEIRFIDQPDENTIFQVVYCGNFDIIEKRVGGLMRKVRRFHHFNPEKTGGKCGCPPGSQKLAIHNTARIIANLGGRGGMKTESGLIIALRAVDEPWNPEWVPYINLENYRCLVLRKNTKDLEDWFRRGKALYCKMGAEAITTPSPRFRWPSGAEFVLDHVQDSDAYEKYQGQEFQTIIWEEVTHCPSLEIFENVVRSVRLSDPRMKERIYCTANPEGAGLGWVRDYFWKLKTPDGNPIRRGEVWFDQRFPLLTRSVIHSTIYDNPYIQRFNPAYVQSLEALTGVKRRRWLDGDFDAFEGSAFDLFRPEGPLDKSEPAEARHVIEVSSKPLAPWWPRVVGFDIGYRHSAAMIKGCITPDRQLVVYDEDAEPGILAAEWGARLARWLLPELSGAPENVIEVFVSHDAFASVGYDRTRAAMIEEGIHQVLPRGTGFTIEQGDNEELADFFKRYEASAKTARIVLRKVPRYWKRVDGWDYIRELMRWKQLQAAKKEHYDPEYAAELVQVGEAGKYAEYMRMFEKSKEELLPKALWTANCVKNIEALRTARFADDNKSDQAAEDILKTKEESDDVLDALRHLCLGFRFKVEHEPRDYWIQRRIQEAIEANPSLDGARLWRVKARLHDEYDREEKNRVQRFTIRMGSPDNRGIRVM